MANYPQYVGKGKSFDDGTYVYTCNACNGTGKVSGTECAWCYGLNVDRIVQEMKAGARGQRYYGLLKAFLSVRGKDIANEVKRIGNVTLIDVGYLSLKFGLNFKAICEWCEEINLFKPGIYERFSRSGVKVNTVYEKARVKYPELAGGES